MRNFLGTRVGQYSEKLRYSRAISGESAYHRGGKLIKRCNK